MKTKDTAVSTLRQRGRRRLCDEEEHDDIKNIGVEKSSALDGIFSVKVNEHVLASVFHGNSQVTQNIFRLPHFTCRM